VSHLFPLLHQTHTLRVHQPVKEKKLGQPVADEDDKKTQEKQKKT
jgi:hypothetical protein